MYKSIIFDIGGVLVDFDPKAYLVDRLCNADAGACPRRGLRL